jgi:arylsulfatase A-like enzyme
VPLLAKVTLVNVAIFSVLAVLLALAATLLLRWSALERTPVEAASFAGTIYFAALQPLSHVETQAWLTERLLLISLVVCGLLGVVGSAYFAALRRGGQGSGEATTVVDAGPGWGLLLLAGCWLQVFVLDALSASSLFVAAGIAAGALAIHRLAARRASAPAVLVVLALLLAAVPWRREVARLAARTGDSPAGSCALLLTVDTLRADTIDRLASRHLGAFFEESVVFERARASAPWTKPSFATIMTGTTPLVHRTTRRGVKLPRNLDTLAELLQERGFRTGAVASNSHLAPGSGFSRGFEHYDFQFGREPLGHSPGARLLSLFGPSTLTERITERSIEWLETHALERFFLWVHYLDPHLPYEPPLQHQPEGDATGRVDSRFHAMADVRVGRFVPDADEKERIRALYAGEVDYIGAEIAHLLQRLEDLRGKDCLVVFTSDHGEEFWEHGAYEHGHSLVEEVIRVPLAVRLPNATAAARIPWAVSTVAIAPTILDTMGLSYGEDRFSHTSLRPYWSGESDVGDRPHLSSSKAYYEDELAVTWKGLRFNTSESDGEHVTAIEPGREPSAEDEAELIDQARSLLADEISSAAILRRRLGLSENEEKELSRSVTEELKALGYL